MTVGSEGSIFKTTNGGETSGTSHTITNDDIHVYPNPALNDLYIDIQNESLSDYSVSIYTMLGQKIFTSKHETPNVHVDISSLNSGVYYVEVSDQHHIKAGRRVLIF